MKKLINGIVEFRKSLTNEKRELFQKLALGQAPDTLFVACCDSRVVPNLFASTDPGDLFVLRNIGNLIPPFSSKEDHSVAATIEFSILKLKVRNIVVCGHSECGAMKAIHDHFDDTSCSNLISWLKNGEETALGRHKDKVCSSLSYENQLSQENVLQQLEHLKTYSIISERLEKKKLQLHAWWFDISHADVYCFEDSLNQYVLIDEEEAQIILKRLS